MENGWICRRGSICKSSCPSYCVRRSSSEGNFYRSVAANQRLDRQDRAAVRADIHNDQNVSSDLVAILGKWKFDITTDLIRTYMVISGYPQRHFRRGIPSIRCPFFSSCQPEIPVRFHEILRQRFRRKCEKRPPPSEDILAEFLHFVTCSHRNPRRGPVNVARTATAKHLLSFGHLIMAAARTEGPMRGSKCNTV